MLKWAHYARKLDIGLLCPNIEIRPQAPKKGIFQNFVIFVERSPDFSSNEPSTTPDIKFKSSYARKRVYAQIWKFSPGSQKWNFSKKINFFKKVSRFRFQRALNHPQTLILSQVMQENVILAYYAQCWNSALGSQKGNFSKFFHFCGKVSRFLF